MNLQMNSWAEHSPKVFFSKYKVLDVISAKNSTNAPKELVYLQEDDTLAKVMDEFHLNKILSAPVLAKGTLKVIGMLDMVHTRLTVLTIFYCSLT